MWLGRFNLTPNPVPRLANARLRTEFITMMTGQTYPPVQEQENAEYAKAWKQFEPSLKGSITQAQFRQLMADLAEPVTDSEVESLINNVDGEGKISCACAPVPPVR